MTSGRERADREPAKFVDNAARVVAKRQCCRGSNGDGRSQKKAPVGAEAVQRGRKNTASPL
jgi:hypothetical protein